MRCKQCGCEIPGNKVNCPNCDFYIYDDPDFVKAEAKTKKIIGISIVGVLALAVGWHMLMTTPSVKINVLGSGIALKMKYRPLKKCVVVEGKVLSCGSKRSSEKCGVSFSDYMKMRSNFKNNMETLGSFFR